MTELESAIALVSREQAVPLGTLLSTWRTDVNGLVLTAIGAAIALGYVSVLFRAKRHGFAEAIAPGAGFFGGLLVCLWAFCSGLGSLSDRAPGVVVADHLALVTLAPALLALGVPFRRLRQAVAQTRFGTPLRSRESILRVLCHPAVAFALLIGLEYVFLLTPVYGWSVSSESGGDLVRGAFLAAGCFYWWPIVGADAWPRAISGGGRMISLAATLPFTAFLGIDFTLTDRRLPHSASLEATHIAGAELWGYPTLFTLAALGAVFWSWMKEEEDLTSALDHGLDTIDAAEAIVQDAEFRMRDGGDT